MVKADTKANLPWVEKYRPSTFDDLVSHEDIIKTVLKFINENQLPHLLFYGPPGTGKTSTILACAKLLYTPAQFSSMVLELNASDDRGIGVVRGQILTFASTKTIFKSGFKLIILDEADAMTMDAQNALRRKWMFEMSDSEEETTEKQLNVVFLGDGNVGKTSIIRRFCYDEFSRQYNQTVGADFYIKRLNLPGKKEITLRISDIGGVELKGHMLKNYLFNANMIILVYDITSSNSFESLPIWLQTVSNLMENPVKCIIFANKNDVEHKRAVRLDKTKQFLNDFKLFSYLGSAKTGETVNSALTEIVASHYGICLSRLEREKQVPIVTAELVAPSNEIISPTASPKANSTVFIEKYTENIRFCIICNYLSKIIPALQSRCTRFRFGPLSPDQILPRLNYVVDEEKVKISEDGKTALLTLANGDMRKVLNVLQSTWLAYKDVTEDNVYTCVGHPLRSDIDNIVKWLLNEDLKTAYKNIQELKTIKGLALNDIITEVHKYIHRIEFPFDIMVDLLDKLAEIEYRLASGTNENIQLTALVSAFHHAKSLKLPSDS